MTQTDSSPTHTNTLETCSDPSNASWKATLTFSRVEGISGSIELFQFTNKQEFRRCTPASIPKVVFDRTHYSNTEAGLQLLIKDLKKAALREGTNLVSRGARGMELRCHRCRLYASAKKQSLVNNPAQTQQTNTKNFDNRGIKLGIRSHTYHRDKTNNRVGGRTLSRSTTTGLPTTKESLCSVCLRLGIKEGENGYIYLKQACGDNIHVNHPKPLPNELSHQTRHLCPAALKLIQSGGNASVGSTSMRSLVLEHQNELVSKGSVCRIQMVQDDSEGDGENSTTAAKMVKWLRCKAADPAVNLHYCFLTCKKNSGTFHKHSKGRVPKGRRISLSQVEEAMTLPHIQLEYVTRKGNEEEVNAPMDATPYQDRDLITSSNHCLGNDGQVLLGAAWVDDASYQQFLRYPEVLFIDSTHKTNNEARPLLLICGRDQNGKAFVVARIFMPNETIAFYRWVFLKCLPALLVSSISPGFVYSSLMETLRNTMLQKKLVCCISKMPREPGVCSI